MGSVEIYDKSKEQPIGGKNRKKVVIDDKFMEPQPSGFSNNLFATEDTVREINKPEVEL